MRILTVAGNYPPCTVGGAEISTELVSRGLAAIGHEVAVLTCGPREDYELDRGVAIHRVASPNLFWSRDGKRHAKPAWAAWYALQNCNPRTHRLVAREIAARRPDILVTHTLENFGASVWAAAAASRVPIVHVLHDHGAICRRSDCFRDGARCMSVCSGCRLLTSGLRSMARHVSGVVGVSDYMIDVHRPVFPGARFVKILNPLDEPGGAARARRYDPRAVTYGYLGRIEQKKGLEILLPVFAKHTAPGRLLVAGTGEPGYVSDLARRFACAGIAFKGWLRPADLLPHIDYLVFPSLLNEGFGRVVAEALSFGVPVILSGRGGATEALIPGVGRTFDPDIPGDLERAIREFRLDEGSYTAVSERARASSTRFAVDSVAAAFTGFLGEIAGAARGPRRCA